MSTTNDGAFPAGLIQAIIDKTTVVFFGAGLSVEAGLPTGTALARALISKLKPNHGFSSSAPPPLDEIAEYFELERDRIQLANEIEHHTITTGAADISPAHFLLATLVKRGYVSCLVTTNYDTLFEDACRSLGVTLKVIVHPSQLHYLGENIPVLIKLHGDFAHPDLLVITRKDYNAFLTYPQRQPLINALIALSQVRPFLFLGYSLRDGNFLQLLERIRINLQNNWSPKSYIAIHNVSEIQQEAARSAQYAITAFAAPDLPGVLYELLAELKVTLRILHLLFAYPNSFQPAHTQFGGIETFVRLIKSKSRHDHTFLPVFRENLFVPGVYKYVSQTDSLELAYPSSFFFHKAACSASLQTILAERRVGGMIPDLIHAHFLAFALQAQAAGFPTICTSHSLLSKDLAFARGVFDGVFSAGARYEIEAVKEAEKLACANLKTITALTQAHSKEVEALGHSFVVQMEAPFDPGPFLRFSKSPEQARASRNLAQTFTISFMGRADRRKGIEVLLEACNLLSLKTNGFQILLISSGIYFSKETRRVDFGLGRFSVGVDALIQNKVQIIIGSPTSEPDVMAEYYQSSDIVVVPSLYEPMGYVVLEAMASGRPVIASKVDGLSELVEHDENGLLFDPGNAAQLAQHLEKLMGDPGRRSKLGEAARNKLRVRSDVKQTVRQWDELYDRAAAGFGASRKRLRTSVEDATKIDALLAEHLANLPVISIHEAIALGCGLATEIGKIQKTPQDGAKRPVDLEVFSFVAHRLHDALRQQARATVVPADALCDMMVNLALSFLNKEDYLRSAIRISGDYSYERLQHAWQSILNISVDEGLNSN